MQEKGKNRTKKWQDTNIGWHGFFNGYATAEKDAIARSRDRVGYIVANLRLMIKKGKSTQELIEFLDRLEAKHA
jgi:hypothetical protein